MESKELVATERIVALDIVAALDMYEGLMGSDETTIGEIEALDRERVKLTLSNGQVFTLAVRETR